MSGLCIIEPRVKNGKSSARASLQEVESAAAYIIDECVNGEPSQGGELHNIGNKKHTYTNGANSTLIPSTTKPLRRRQQPQHHRREIRASSAMLWRRIPFAAVIMPEHRRHHAR